MAKIYRCDRCKSESVNSDSLWSIAMPVGQLDSGDSVNLDSVNFDLCFTCISSLWGWLKEKK